MRTATAEGAAVELARSVILRLPAALIRALDEYAAGVELPGGGRLSRNAAVRHLIAIWLKQEAKR